MLRQSLFSIVSAKNLGRITQPCRHYTSENAILTDINKQMFRVLDKAASANLGSRATLTRILRLAKELKENNVKFDADTYEHILSAYAKANEPSQALILYKQMSAQGIKPTRNFYHKALLVSTTLSRIHIGAHA
ncbi:uncharacterized protein B0P05DRAFT_539622 [Gilbertella persicaria]|uniref:uncharacterized protein n=1 Tax=Gilbertella persicaria TaxID=101096 RepID=UPI00221EC767|nr:uncharacterized protein B0P05DRAFT_539622 [Gilbertella persicaria]KAI8080786.1 hypothetical protein B0P05DRAFT_539622 [Gilbertella persicaria]